MQYYHLSVYTEKINLNESDNGRGSKELQKQEKKNAEFGNHANNYAKTLTLGILLIGNRAVFLPVFQNYKDIL